MTLKVTTVFVIFQDSEDEWVEAEDVPQLGSADKSWKVQKEKSDLAENSVPKQVRGWAFPQSQL